MALVRLYIVFLSPLFGGACKFYPSCSNYAQEALVRHGARKGAALAAKRLLRCRPFTKGGFDPVPDVCESEELYGSESSNISGAQTLGGGLSVERRL